MSNFFWNERKVGSLKDKVIIVTGGNSGLGFEAVKFYASKGATVILACRDIKKGETAKQKIESEKNHVQIDILELDLADMISIRKFSESFRSKYQRLDILINNAGIMVVPYGKTKDGYESQIGVNHLGHFALTGLLFNCLKETSSSRIITISSMAHIAGTMTFNNLLYENGGYTPFGAYARSKLANLLFTYELQRRIGASKIDMKALAAHPGVSKTNLFRHVRKNFFTYLFYPVFFIFTQSAYRGALPGIRAALEKDITGGSFYGPLFYLFGSPIKMFSSPLSYNKAIAKKLWEVSERLTGVYYNF
jgi:NAD(P)-dependent dehydrogenase (short-subunit alcohol dehydrogenase family)